VSKSLKVLHLTTSNSGGAGIAASRLNRALNESGDIDSQIVFMKTTNGINESSEHKIDGRFYYQIRSRLMTIFQQRIIQSSTKLVSPIEIDLLPADDIRYRDADVIHFHSFYNFLSLGSIKKAVKDGKKVFVTLHDQRFFTGGCHHSSGCDGFKNQCLNCPQVRGPFKPLTKRELERRIKSLHNLTSITIISPSDWLAIEARKSAALGNFNIQVVRNPIPPVNTIPRPEEFKKSLGIRGNRVVLGFISLELFNPYKGLQTLLNAISKLEPDERKNFELLLIGGSVTKIETSIPHYQVSSKSEQSTYSAIRCMDLLIVPSDQDNLPNVIGEALMLGVPVLGSDAGGVPELLLEAGLETFKAGDENDLISKIRSHDFSKKFDKSYAEKNLSFTEIAREVKSLYER